MRAPGSCGPRWPGLAGRPTGPRRCCSWPAAGTGRAAGSRRWPGTPRPTRPACGPAIGSAARSRCAGCAPAPPPEPPPEPPPSPPPEPPPEPARAAAEAGKSVAAVWDVGFMADLAERLRELDLSGIAQITGPNGVEFEEC